MAWKWPIFEESASDLLYLLDFIEAIGVRAPPPHEYRSLEISVMLLIPRDLLCMEAIY